ncbi:hypothetical protein NQZ68_019773 [Dissostichus eleginoides]|nr:hypothetical protein NQZ68_019773 [Dissostichus eleginoides]
MRGEKASTALEDWRRIGKTEWQDKPQHHTPSLKGGAERKPCPPSPSHLVGPGVFVQGSVLWNVNMRLCVKPEEPTSTGDKTPPTPGRGGGAGGWEAGGRSERVT